MTPYVRKRGVRRRRREYVGSWWWGGVDELDDTLAFLNDLDVTCSFDLDAFVRERTQ